MPKYVYDFAEGDLSMADLLGGKGANLAEMTVMGLPVPPGFTITTEACRAFLATGAVPEGLDGEVDEHLHALERAMGRKLGQADGPLLVAVRSGARFSMPGMMDTVLDIGLTDDSVAGLAAWAGDERLAWDSYRRLVQMFGTTVLGVEAEYFAAALRDAKRAKGATGDLGLDTDDLRVLTATFKDIVRDRTGRDFPQDPRAQLGMAITSVFASWHTDRARIYRRAEHIPEDLGTAVNVCAMVFGNLGDDSGTGVAFTRDPATGAPGVYGDYLPDAQGEDVVAGIRNTLPLHRLADLQPRAHERLMEIMAALEGRYRDLCDIEFTVERGKLWMLQTRVGKRTAAAAFRIADALREEGLIDADEALRRVTGAQLGRLMFPRFADTDRTPLATGVAASPGAAVGAVVFDSATAVRRGEEGTAVILVRRETDPDDLDGMIHARGVLTSRGGKTSHAAVVARGLGRTCVCGAESLTVDAEARRFTTADGTVVAEGDVISVDGTSGAVYAGGLPVVPSPVADYFEGRRPAEGDELLRAVDRIITHADRRRRLEVRANADTPEDAARARRLGATGIGLCRTEHMFLGDRRVLVERLILAADDNARAVALAALLPLQRNDFTRIFEEMDGLPVTIRLLDPPLHEFLPDRVGLTARVAVAKALGDTGAPEDLLRAVDRLHERNPMLGTRGVRLGLLIPELYDLQLRAIAEAVSARILVGGRPHVEIMVPLVGDARELEVVAAQARRTVADVARESGVDIRYRIGTMIELPRAAVTAGRIAATAGFFSFGTNDLTQTVWGFSRDDVEGSFFPTYLAKGVFTVSPFETLDREGVGRLIEIAVREGRDARPDLTVGVCGEHGGDPASIRFFHEAGLDYVSCSPFRVPVARLEAGRAAVGDADPTTAGKPPRQRRNPSPGHDR
ncbi:pyruvate, phosphate dikinase [Saccharothrix violaceirubra]|uniref:Pyruvate, phosphate dikinase n=1 Tax=Saccharothrix violaceirubra TaxID=413306 RepID=A0A7W7T5F4_9PSEU|nr:pyruvate, phosphate dikinase [Saccharothrix violaceirubra]MBB4966928.1 pyruvate,orthophosphate dikinase [Saccharothrix violaceirubra]